MNPGCRWPNCECKTEDNEPCKFDNPDFYINKVKEPKAMTCRFELEFKGEPFPRSCPTCGLSGKCHKGYEQIRKEKGGYALVNDAGVNSSGLRIGIDGKPYRSHHSSTFPDQSFIKKNEEENFKAKSEVEIAKQAANPKAVATGDLGLPSGDALRGKGVIREISTKKRLKLCGYLVDNFDKRGSYTIHDLNGMVDKIAAILLDD